MPNRMRGEVEARLGDKSYTLCLTLGALAELESALDAPDILALAERFEAGRLKAGDAIRILGAGLRGGGNAVTDEEVAAIPIEGGAVGALRVVGELLKATFRSGRGRAAGKAAGAAGRIDWRRLMALGIGALGMAPKDFWRMTPAELEAAMEGRFGRAPVAPFARADFEALMRAYPDEGT